MHFPSSPTRRTPALVPCHAGAVRPLALLVALWAVPLAAQEGPVLPIAEVLRDADGDFVPDRIGQTVELVGVANREPAIQRGSRFVTIQDSVAGIRLFTPEDTVLLRDVHAGDVLHARGRLVQYRGADELEITWLRKAGSAPVPRPHDVLAADLNSERFSRQLVRASGTLGSTVRPDGGRDYWLRDRSGVVRVSIATRFLSDPEIARRLADGGAVEVVGVAGQADMEPPFNSDYYLAPREVTDLRFAPVPPDRTPLFAGALLTLAVLALYLFVRRRTAERRARELGALSEELRRSGARFRALIEQAQEIITVVAADRTIRYESPAVERVLGYAVGERMSRDAFEFLHPDDLPRVQDAFDRAVEETVPTAAEYRVRHKDGSYRVLQATWMSMLAEPAVAGVVVNSRDITEFRRSEERLRQAQKMEAVGRLAGGIAHDFNNVLTVIKGNTCLALMDLPEDSPTREDVEQIGDAADRAANLTRQLLAFSRQQVLQSAALNLNAIVSELERMLRRTLGEDIEFVTVLDPELGAVEADAGQIEQILMNLAVNARDAMPAGGKLITQTGNVEVSEPFASQLGHEVAPGPYVMLVVSDTGSGMPKEVIARIFEPFYTTKPQGKGTGLGLATVYGIVKQSGGYIWVHSEEGQGTSFKIYLPRVDAQTQSSPGQSPSHDLPGRSATILLVEDDVAVRATARRMLERMGYRILEAGDGEEALRVAERHEGMIDLLLTDVVMPLMGGRELAEQLTVLWPDIRVLYASGYTDEAVVRQGILEGSAPFLQKPYGPESLIRKVTEVLDAADGGA